MISLRAVDGYHPILIIVVYFIVNGDWPWGDFHRFIANEILTRFEGYGFSRLSYSHHSSLVS
jgi:hypothetical protein